MKQKTKLPKSEVKKQLNPTITLIYLCILFTFFISAFAYNLLPAQIITHWGLNGEPNGFMPKEIGLIIMPLLITLLTVILYYVPNLDPLKKNIKEFKEDYTKFILVFAAFMLYVQIITITLNLGLNINIGVLLAPAFAVLFYSIGTLFGKVKKNYFIGIRTPWTLNSENVWNKTHKLGEKLFKTIALINLLGLIFPEYFVILLIMPTILCVIILMTYSYIEYKKEKQN